jgi:hypothetical protein
MKFIYKLILISITTIIFTQTQLRAISAMEVLGTAGKIGNWIYGETTVVPATSINRWRMIDKVHYFGIDSRTYRSVSRNHITGAFKYFFHSKSGAYVEKHENPFIIEWIGRQSFRCDTYGDGKAVYSSLQNFNVAARAASVTKTGAFPPGEPYDCAAKSFGFKLPSDCYQVAGGRNYREPFKIYDSGHVVFQFDEVNVEYAWPVLSWAGHAYRY